MPAGGDHAQPSGMICVSHRRIATARGVLAVMAAMLAIAPAASAEPAEVAAGRLIAQHNCGGCHATGAGRSPFRDAPPFRRLYRRYRRGHLDALLAEGQLPPDHQDEEGELVRNPRMPHVPLGLDEVASLKAYLLSLDPREKRRR
jgi:cytochrome c